MDFLERVARAVHAEHNDNRAAAIEAANPNWDGWKSWLPVVRVMLATMREPSEAMITAGVRSGGWSDYYDDEGEFRAPADDAWRAMIDAAMA